MSAGTSGAAHVGGLQRAVSGPDGRRCGRPGPPPRRSTSGTHAPEHVEEAGPARADVDVLDDQVAAGGDAGGDDPEGGLGRVARHVEGEGLQRRRAHRHRPWPHHDVGTAQGRAAPRCGSGSGCPPARSSRRSAARPASRMAAFDLGARHRQAVVDARAARRRGRPAAAGGRRGGRRPGRPWPAAGRRPGPWAGGRSTRRLQDGQPVEPGRPAGQQADAGAGVADVDDRVRLVQAARRRRRRPSRRPSPVVTRRRKPATAATVWATSSAVERPWSRERPSARAASSRARWEMDLSPGTRSRPCRPPAGAPSDREGAHRAISPSRRNAGRYPRAGARERTFGPSCGVDDQDQDAPVALGASGRSPGRRC